MGEALHALSPMTKTMPVQSSHDESASSSHGRFDIAAFLERYRQAMERQSTEPGKQTVLQTYGENALAMLEAMQTRAAATSPWRAIDSLPLTGQLVWLRNGDSIAGPCVPDTYHLDQYTHWAPCVAPAV